MKKYFRLCIAVCLGLALLIPTCAWGRSLNVASLSELQTASNSAHSGDTLLLANGTYQSTTLTVSKNGIVVRAATLDSVFVMAIKMSHMVISF